ncbi:MAG: lipopolysaccharide biosynthesis protein, partial [Sulfurovaceae bacterium]|nr:lipopolysaccharide biosynthesis protein [Sulfurovaceae bacterium]
IGLWIIPYLVKNIGLSAYGLVPLAMFFSAYINIIIQSLNSAINRFLLIAIQQNSTIEANRVFNTSLIIILSFIALQSIIMTIVIINLSYLISIPIGLESDAFWLFLLTFIGFSISLLRGVFATTLFAHNRLDILRLIDIIQIISRALIIIFLFSIDTPQLIYVGIANILASIIIFLLTLYYSRKIYSSLHVNFALFDRKYVKELSQMGIWVLINQIGSLLFLKIDLFIANRFLGASMAGEYAIILQWNTLIRVFAGLLSGVITPITMIFYAKNKREDMIKMVKIAFKLMAIGMSVIIGEVTALSGDILSVWMGEEFRYLEYLMFFSLLPLIINLSVYPLFAIQTAYNRVKIPAIVTLILGLANLILAIVLVKWTTIGLYGIVLASATILTLKNSIFTPIYASHLLKIPLLSFTKYYLLSIFFYISSYSITTIFASFYHIDSYLILFSIMGLSILLSLIVFYIYLRFDNQLYQIFNKLLEYKKFKKGKS